ncbi:cache domain-containing protein, partial [Noviherbaspirillum denitrificans]|uniref:cache domain-containing protein n=1 Tax=Noviherbaspirillum denitrificans TaxID=1968433 RepID=UPI00197D25CE
MKIRTYLSLTAAAVLVPVIVFATAALHMLLDAERKAALNAMQATARATALSVDRELAAAEARLRTLATSHYLLRGDLANFYNQSRETLNGDYAWILLSDRSGRQLFNTSAPYGEPLSRLAHPEPGAEAMRTGSIHVTNLREGSAEKRPVVSVEVPLPHPDGLILSQSFVAEYFNRAFDRAAIPPDGVIGIIDRNGITVARSRAGAQFVGKPTVPDLTAAARRAEEGVVRTRSLDGVEIYGIYTHSKLSGWIVGI